MTASVTVCACVSGASLYGRVALELLLRSEAWQCFRGDARMRSSGAWPAAPKNLGHREGESVGGLFVSLPAAPPHRPEIMNEPQAETTTSTAEHVTDGGAWLLVLSSVFLCNLLKILLPSCSSIISRLIQKDAEQESEMRSEIQNMKQELSTISMMDEFARYARLERKINKMTDKLKTHVKTRTAQLAKIKWVINIVFYILQAALMISLIWKYYSEPVTVLPSKWLAPLERLVAFPTGVAGGVGITCWLVVCNKVVALMLHSFS